MSARKKKELRDDRKPETRGMRLFDIHEGNFKNLIPSVLRLYAYTLPPPRPPFHFFFTPSSHFFLFLTFSMSVSCFSCFFISTLNCTCPVLFFLDDFPSTLFRIPSLANLIRVSRAQFQFLLILNLPVCSQTLVATRQGAANFFCFLLSFCEHAYSIKIKTKSP